MIDNDAAVVEAVKAGDIEAYRGLVGRHKRKPYGVLIRLVGDPDVAEELAQETFVKAYAVVYQDGARLRLLEPGWCISTVHAAIDGWMVAILADADPPKPGSRETASALKRLGMSVAMLTGNSRATAEAIAWQVGIDSVFSEVLPDQKVSQVQRLQKEGRRVAFVGDGINDAPALAQADVGLAIGTGADIAVEAGDVILMSGDPRGIVTAAMLARRTLRVSHGNFFWAYAYNAALIPVAAGALFPFFHLLLNPMLAAGAMSFSIVFVVMNSRQLRRFKAPLPQ